LQPLATDDETHSDRLTIGKHAEHKVALAAGRMIRENAV